MRSAFSGAGMGIFFAAMSPALGAPLTLIYDTYVESKTLSTRLDSATSIFLEGLLPDRGGASFNNELTFTAGSSALSLSAGWRSGPPDVRTTAVNIDLVDFTNTLIASDTFLGLVGTLATSQLTATGLIPGGRYTLITTGIAQQGGRFQIDLVDGSSPPAIPQAPVVPTSPSNAVFDTLVGEKGLSSIFASGDVLQIDGVLTESGAITNKTKLRITANTLSAGITWLVAPGPQRTNAVNIDLLDATNNVVSSDVFMGLSSGQAFSQFVATGLSPGNYTLLFTGNALQGGRYRIDLATDPTAPAFEPIEIGVPPVDVPEPQTLMLFLFGLAGLAFATRSVTARIPK